MKRIITSAFIILLTIGAANAQDVKGHKGHDGQRKEHMMGGYEKLNLTADQKAKMQALKADYKKQSEDLKKQDKLTVAEMKERRKALHEQFKTKADAILTADQRAQAAKMRAEHKADGKQGKWNKDGMGKGKRGEGMYGDHDQMMKDLNLTADQQTKMQQINTDFRSRMQAIRNDNTLTQEQKKTKFQELAQQHRTQVQSILTKEQQDKMQQQRKDFKKYKGAKKTK